MKNVLILTARLPGCRRFGAAARLCCKIRRGRSEQDNYHCETVVCRFRVLWLSPSRFNCSCVHASFGGGLVPWCLAAVGAAVSMSATGSVLEKDVMLGSMILWRKENSTNHSQQSAQHSHPSSATKQQQRAARLFV